MNMNYEKMKDWQDDARSGLREEAERLEEKVRQVNALIQVLDVTDELVREIDDLKEEQESKQREIDDLNDDLEEKEAEINNIRRQLLEEKERRLTAETKLSELAMREASRMVIVTGNYNDVHDNGGVGMNSLKNQ